MSWVIVISAINKRSFLMTKFFQEIVAHITGGGVFKDAADNNNEVRLKGAVLVKMKSGDMVVWPIHFGEHGVTDQIVSTITKDKVINSKVLGKINFFSDSLEEFINEFNKNPGAYFFNDVEIIEEMFESEPTASESSAPFFAGADEGIYGAVNIEKAKQASFINRTVAKVGDYKDKVLNFF